MSQDKLKESIDALQEGDESKFHENVKEVLVEEFRSRVLNEKEEEEKEDKVTYNKVYNAMAKHFDVKPSEVDDMEKDKKDDFYNKLDKCWDEEENKIPDGCPVDLKKYME